MPDVRDDPSELLSLDAVRAAGERIQRHVHRTPFIRSATLSAEFGAPIHLKMECLQKTGSFKPRGAFNKLAQMTPQQRDKGVVSVSGGNHAQGLAFAARTLGVEATICMPSTTPPNYVEATRGYGAEIVFADDIHQAFATAERLRREGLLLVHPFDDREVAAGQGTIALEILEDLPSVSRVYVSIGGGGLIAGMAAVFKSVNPRIRVIGVETRGADAMARSVAAGEIVELTEITSIARTLGAPRVSPMTFRHVNEWVDEVMVVEDQEAIDAMKFILERTKTLVEPAAACCLAAARQHKSEIASNDPVALLMCGGNVSVTDLARWSTARESEKRGQDPFSRLD